MAIRVHISTARLEEKLKKLGKKYKEAESGVVVGYTAFYAVWVHEDLEAGHKPGQRAKYLEEPARTKQAEMTTAIAAKIEAKAPLIECLRAAGEVLKRESRLIVPVSDDGNNGNPPGFLRDSAFVRLATEPSLGVTGEAVV